MVTETVLGKAAQGDTAAATEKTQPSQQPAAANPATPTPAEKPATPSVAESKPAVPEAEQKPTAETEVPKAKAPEKYTLQVPDGFQLDTELQGKFEPLLRKLDLDNDQAQALIDLSVEQQKKTLAAVEAQRVNQANAWETEFRNDPGFGGANFDQSLSLVRDAINRYGEPTLLKELSESEWGSNPRLLKLLAKVGKATKEDNAANVSTTSRESASNPLRELYPTMAR